MKKKFLLTILMTIFCVSATLGLTACVKHTHTYNETITVPTCTEQGYTTYTCSCGDSYIENYVNALGHTETLDSAVTPTCTKTGLTEGKHCSVCNKVIVAQQTISATGHSFTQENNADKYLKTVATCEDKAVYWKSCSCGEKGTDTFEYGSALGHSYGNFTSNGNGTHSKVCANDANHIKTEPCAGGTASSEGIATCSICGGSYQQATDAFSKLKYYIISEGEYDSEDNEYNLKFEPFTYEGLLYGSFSYYRVDENELRLCIMITNGSSPVMMSLIIDKIDGVYGWSYIDSADNFMYGNVTASTYTKNTTLTYTDYIAPASQLTTIRNLASSMLNIILTFIEIEYSDIGVTAVDFGFTYFDSSVHTHTYNKQVTTSTYLHSSATCDTKAKYYYSCECGEKGTTTFEYGSALGHSYGGYTSNGNGTHTKTCSRNSSHKVTENCSGGTASSSGSATCSYCGGTYQQATGTFTKVKNYIISRGTYDSSDRQYDVNFGSVTLDGLVYQTGASYDLDDGDIILNIAISNGSMLSVVVITIDSIDGVYTWSYLDSYDYFMYGTLYASSWTSSSLLSVTSYDVPSSLVTSTRKLASSMVSKLVSDIKYDYSSIGVTAKDFGFTNF